MNDNEPKDKIIKFKKKNIVEDKEVLSISLRNGYVCLEIENGAIMLTPRSTLDLAFILMTALKAILETRR